MSDDNTIEQYYDVQEGDNTIKLPVGFQRLLSVFAGADTGLTVSKKHALATACSALLSLGGRIECIENAIGELENHIANNFEEIRVALNKEYDPEESSYSDEDQDEARRQEEAEINMIPDHSETRTGDVQEMDLIEED